jgi:hypothetical protein
MMVTVVAVALATLAGISGGAFAACLIIGHKVISAIEELASRR